jgi:S-DNA-T family DNA segregation ATPase FtsK/SpoIIIE
MGIELPNADRQTVSFKELAASEAFAGHKGNLPMILGKDIAGDPVVADLAAMPHLLVAGHHRLGQVGRPQRDPAVAAVPLHSQRVPADPVDPKISSSRATTTSRTCSRRWSPTRHKSVRALKWAVEEMERRYRMMSDIGARNLGGFNERVATAIAKGKPLGRRVQTGFDPDTGEELIEEEQLDYQVLPQIVLIVDELADLMITVGKEIEVLIQRLSQKSRAAGIHLIMATQRPSVDVITGVIKANLPTPDQLPRHQPHRQPHDPRRAGRRAAARQGRHALQAELGRAAPRPRPVRQRRGGRARRQPLARPGRAGLRRFGHRGARGQLVRLRRRVHRRDNPEERKYRQACQIVFENQKASGSWLQRQMGVGYNTAAKWIERMEADGFVGPANHVGRRDIYRDRDGNPPNPPRACGRVRGGLFPRSRPLRKREEGTTLALCCVIPRKRGPSFPAGPGATGCAGGPRQMSPFSPARCGNGCARS